MTNLRSCLLYLMTILLLLSCNKQEIDNSMIFQVVHQDFDDYLETQGTVEALNSVGIACPRDIDGKVIYLIEDGKLVNEGDTLCILEDQNLQNNYENLLTQKENLEAEFNKTKANLAMEYSLLEAQVNDNEAQTKISQLDSAQLQFMTSNQQGIKKLELEIVQVQKTGLKKKLASLQKIQESVIRSSELRLKSMDNNISKMEETLRSLIILSPQSGMTIRAYSWLTGKKLQEGDQIWGSMPIVQIPDLAKMKVTLRASEMEFKRIETGDSVSYHFDALPGNHAWGKITLKAPVGKPVSQNSTVKYFELEASIDSCLTLPEPGLSTRMRIHLQHLSDTITLPGIAVFDKDSSKFVYVLQGKYFEEREVKTSLFSGRDIVINKGIKVGEKLSLIKPENRQIKVRKLLNDSTIQL